MFSGGGGKVLSLVLGVICESSVDGKIHILCIFLTDRNLILTVEFYSTKLPVISY